MSEFVPPGAIGCLTIGESGIGIPGVCFPGVEPAVTQVIPSYLYWQYQDDDDLWAFVNSQNALAQLYINWFNALNLPIYTGGVIAGLLLDWVGAGLYGMPRPILSNGFTRAIGPLNTFYSNLLTANQRKVLTKATFTPTTDDIYRRIITWHFYKGDGKVINLRWLKRRIMRFLIGEDGKSPIIDQTYQISIILGYPNIVTIRLLTHTTRFLNGCVCNTFTANGNQPPNNFKAVLSPIGPQFAFGAILQEAINNGVLELPFQFVYVVVVQRNL